MRRFLKEITKEVTKKISEETKEFVEEIVDKLKEEAEELTEAIKDKVEEYTEDIDNIKNIPRRVSCDQCEKFIGGDKLACFSNRIQNLDFCSEDCYLK
jgi:polyhydroxyalkanoate synthesis regulator phasin